MVVVAAAGQQLPPLPQASRSRLTRELEQGPLEGMAAGMRALDGRADVAFISAVDVPLLHADFVRAVMVAARARRRWRCRPARAATTTWRRRIATELRGLVEQLLISGERRAGAVADSVPVTRIDAAALPHPESLRNANTPDQLEELRRSASA